MKPHGLRPGAAGAAWPGSARDSAVWSAASRCACSAASIISSSRRSSRRIQRPCLEQARVLQSPVERGGGDQVDGPAEEGCELVGELLDLPAEPAARLQLVEHVDVAVGGGGPAGDGT